MSSRFIKNFKIDKVGSLTHLSENLRKSFGRSFGKKVARHRHRGSKRRARVVDFYRAIWNIAGVAIKCDYDSSRRKPIILVSYPAGFLTYLPAIYGFRIGFKLLFNSFFYKISLKCTGGSFLFYVPQQRKINNVEYRPLQGSKIVRSPGCYAKINKKNMLHNWVKLPSGNTMKLSSTCFACFGSLKFIKYNIGFYKTAGYVYLIGFKPRVRGVAKNPVDHPHGGGEGKKSGKSISMSPWGKLIKGKKTSFKKNNEKI